MKWKPAWCVVQWAAQAEPRWAVLGALSVRAVGGRTLPGTHSGHPQWELRGSQPHRPGRLHEINVTVCRADARRARLNTGSPGHWQRPGSFRHSACVSRLGSWEPPGTQAGEMPHPLGRNKKQAVCPTCTIKAIKKIPCETLLLIFMGRSVATSHSHSFPHFLLSSIHHTLLHSPHGSGLGGGGGGSHPHPPALALAPTRGPISGK